MRGKFKKYLAVLTLSLPAIIYITWLAAYYWLLEAGRYKAFIQPRLWPLLILAPIGVAGAIASRWLWPHLGRRRASVIAYIIAISIMVWGSLLTGARSSTRDLPLRATTSSTCRALTMPSPVLVLSRHNR